MALVASPNHSDSDRAWLSAAEIARKFGLNVEQVRKRLARAMSRDFNCFRELENRKVNEPRYVFHLGTVRPCLADLLPSDDSRPEEISAAETRLHFPSAAVRRETFWRRLARALKLLR